MASNYFVSDVAIDDSQAFLRVCTLKSAGGEYSTLAVSLDRRFPGKSEAPGIKALNEVYLPLDTGTIEAVDGDPERQESFLRSHSRMVDGTRINVCLVNYMLAPGEKPAQKTLEYLNDLLLWSRNHVYLPPTLTFDKSDRRPQEERVQIFDDFVTNLLSLKNQTVNGNLRVGVVIPKFYPRGSLDSLFDLFSKENTEPGFVAIDYANSKFESSSIEQKVALTHRHFANEKEERYFVYGMRVRPRRKGPPPGCAEDITSLMSGLNAVGRTHRDAPMNSNLPPFGWDAMIAFHRSRYLYDCLLSEQRTRESFEQYLSDQNIGVPDFSKAANPDDKKYGTHARNFARRELNVEGAQLAAEVRSSDTEAIKKRLRGKEATLRARALRGRI